MSTLTPLIEVRILVLQPLGIVKEISEKLGQELMCELT